MLALTIDTAIYLLYLVFEVMKMEFKDRLKALRLEKEMTQTELASKFGKSESAVRMWELGKSKPDTDTLIKLAEHFVCTTDYLLGLSEYRNREDKAQMGAKMGEILSLLNIHSSEDKESLLFSFEKIVTLTASLQADNKLKEIARGLISMIQDDLIFFMFGAIDMYAWINGPNHYIKRESGVMIYQSAIRAVQNKIRRITDFLEETLNIVEDALDREGLGLKDIDFSDFENNIVAMKAFITANKNKEGE